MLPINFEVIPTLRLFFTILSILRVSKNKKNTSRTRKILKFLQQVDLIFLSMCAKNLIEIPNIASKKGVVTAETK